MNSFVHAAIGPVIGGRRTFTKSKQSQEMKSGKTQATHHSNLYPYMPKTYILSYTCKIEIAKVLQGKIVLKRTYHKMAS